MKKLITSCAMMTMLVLSACSSTGTVMPATNTGNTIGNATNVGMNIFKSAVDTQCRHEIEKQNAWQIAQLAMSSEQQEAAKSRICSCVTEQAPQQVTVADLTNAAIDSSYRQELVVNVVAKSLQSCYSSSMSQSS